LAYSQTSRLHMDAEQARLTVQFGTRALALAEQFEDWEVVAHAQW